MIAADDAEQLRSFRRKLWSMSQTPDLLHDLMGFAHFAEMAITRDGMLIARLWGDQGFDVFVGTPTPSMLNRTARLWQELTEPEKRIVLDRLREQGIAPDRVGILEAGPERPDVRTGRCRL